MKISFRTLPFQIDALISLPDGSGESNFALCQDVFDIFPEVKNLSQITFEVNKRPSKKKGEKKISIGLLNFRFKGRTFFATRWRTGGILNRLFGPLAPGEERGHEWVDVYVRPIL